MRFPAAAGIAACLGVPAAAHAQTDIYDSGGPLMAEQAAYDVGFYDLVLSIDPAKRSIRGTLAAHVTVREPMEWLVLDLDTLLVVDSVVGLVPESRRGRRSIERRGGKIWIGLGGSAEAGERVAVNIWYGGRPLSTPYRRGTWSDGFIWTETASGDPWIGVVSVLNGADIWWPTKDHPSDEPDSMSLRITVPQPLVVASNGRLRGVSNNADGTDTHHWFISTPVNNYGVTINVAPYRVITEPYESVTGETFPFSFWVLPEHYDDGLRQFPQFKRHLRFFEETLGPYPFRIDKYGVAETPYLGMEHQSIIAYGSDFQDNEFGFDWLHFHELSHEWWANMVTAADWKDWWLHESFGSYMEALYAEHLGGLQAYHDHMPDRPVRFANEVAVAPRTTQRTRDIYGGDIYGKGKWILHSLRHLIGKDAMLEVLRRMAYPDPTRESAPGGCQCRLASTDEFRDLVEELSGLDLGWFFDVYLHQPQLPRLTATRENEILVLRWHVPDDLPFPMPLEVRIGDEVHLVPMERGVGVVSVPINVEPIVDPGMWVLMEFDGDSR
jgi:aminopeptidase N